MTPKPQAGSVVLYAATGSALTRYDIDVGTCTLIRGDTFNAPDRVHYAWPDAGGAHLYVASSSQEPHNVAPGGRHTLSAFRIDPVSAALIPHGPGAALTRRPVHMTLDAPGRHAFVTYPKPAGVTVHRINSDGTLGAEVPQPGQLDPGIYPHQIRGTPSGRAAIIVARGNNAGESTPEDPGSLQVLASNEGVLSHRASIAPGGGFGFGPRHIDFDPSGRWLYVALERQNQVQVFGFHDDLPGAQALYARSTLLQPDSPIGHRQMVGTVHVHPQGGFVYVANRASGATQPDGTMIFEGGENSIAVFKVNPQTGEPTLIQNADTHGIHPRTFAIDPSGRMLVVAHISPCGVREGPAIRNMPACLTTFRLGSDGRLAFVAKYDVDTAQGRLFWMGMVARA